MPTNKQQKANGVAKAQKNKAERPTKVPDVWMDSTPSTRDPKLDRQEIDTLRNKYKENRFPTGVA